MKASGRVEDVYDGIALNEEEIYRIKNQIVDVMTYHSLDYLDDKRIKK